MRWNPHCPQCGFGFGPTGLFRFVNLLGLRRDVSCPRCRSNLRLGFAPYLIATLAVAVLLLVPASAPVPMPLLALLVVLVAILSLAGSVKVMAVARPNMVGFLGLQDDV